MHKVFLIFNLKQPAVLAMLTITARMFISNLSIYFYSTTAIANNCLSVSSWRQSVSSQ